jgi:Fe-S-cluster containining protein
MKRNAREAADRRLAELYDQVPELDCKGLCYTACGIIECSTREHERIKQVGGVQIPTMAEFLARDRAGETITCPALSAVGRCTVYEVRPMICRVWGSAEGMPCPYGCMPKDGAALLTDPEAYELLGDAIEAGGASDGRNGITGAMLREFMEQQPGVIDPILKRGRDADRRHAQAHDRHLPGVTE